MDHYACFKGSKQSHSKKQYINKSCIEIKHFVASRCIDNCFIIASQPIELNREVSRDSLPKCAVPSSTVHLFHVTCYNFLIFTPTGYFQFSVHLTCMSQNCWKKLEKRMHIQGKYTNLIARAEQSVGSNHDPDVVKDSANLCSHVGDNLKS